MANSGKDRGKKEEEDSKASKEDNEASIEEKSAKSTFQSILSLIDAKDWEDIIGNLVPSRQVLTKEQYELINSQIAVKEYVILHNLYEFIKNLSLDQCSLDRLIQLLVISKIGAILINFKQVRLQTLTQLVQIQSTMYNTVVNAIATIAQLIPSVSFNVVANLKYDSVFIALTTALALIGSEIGTLKNNIRELINDNEFCIKSCICDMQRVQIVASDKEVDHVKALDNVLKQVASIVEREINAFDDQAIKQLLNKVISDTEFKKT